jgi:hypothetical protein
VVLDVSDESLVTAVRSGDRRRSLERMRDQLAERLEAAEGKDAAVISKELREVMRELESIPTGKEVSTSDDLAAKRAARLAEAAAAERAAAGE